MARVLMVAEKPSIARSISKALSGNNYNQLEGLSQTCHLFSFKSEFLGSPAQIHVTSVLGHLYNLDFPEDYQSWQKDALALYDAETLSVEIKNEGYDHEGVNVIQHLQFEAKNCTHLVLWLDCDLEGENICFEVISVVKTAEKSLRKDNIYRANFSSLTEVDIKKAFGLLRRPKIEESRAVDARREIDLKVGVSFTRFQTGFFQDKYGVLRTRMISFGPCQTPTLGFCVERSDARENFQRKPHYLLALKLAIKPPLTAEINFESEAEAKAVKAKFEKVKAQGAKVINTNPGTKEIPSPQALNTVEMLKLASSRLKLSPYDAMDTAEQLYLSGCITYPRTETTSYAESFQLRETVGLFQEHPEWGGYCKALLRGNIEAKRGKDVGDHPPITPCKSTTSFASFDQERLYQLIVQYFLATVSADVKYDTHAVTFLVAEREFTVTGTTTIQVGFAALKMWMSVPQHDVDLSGLHMNDVCQLISVEILAKETVPPEYLTESELLGMMEASSIGTAGSMATHIQHICDRNYVQVDTNSRALVPTELGKMLVHGYKKIDPELVSPAIRGRIEESMNRIAEGDENTYKKELQSALALYKEKFKLFRKRIDKIDAFFKEAFTQISESSGTHLKRLGIRNISRKGGWGSCFNCGQDGHQIQDCPKPDSRTCFNCGQKGHVNRECTERTPEIQTCYSCGAEGHIDRDCPNDRDRYRESERGRFRGRRGVPRRVERGFTRGSRRGGRVIRGSCFKCQEAGHLARDCPHEGSQKFVF